jgi:hypothetical protein
MARTAGAAAQPEWPARTGRGGGQRWLIVPGSPSMQPAQAPRQPDLAAGRCDRTTPIDNPSKTPAQCGYYHIPRATCSPAKTQHYYFVPKGAGYRITRYFPLALWGVRNAHEYFSALQVRGIDCT